MSKPNDTPDAVRLRCECGHGKVTHYEDENACCEQACRCEKFVSIAALRAENDELKRELEKYRQIIPKLPDPNDPDYWKP